MKIAIVVYDFDLEISPSIKAVIAFLQENGHQVFVFDNTIRPVSGKRGRGQHKNLIENFPLLYWRSSCLFAKGWNFFLRCIHIEKIRKKAFAHALSHCNLSDFDYFVACEFGSLLALNYARIASEKIVYLSLELEQMMTEYHSSFAASLIQKCRKAVIQSPERAAELNNYLNSKIQFSFLPVSIYPAPPHNPEKEKEGVIRLIYSGAFAEWGGVEELVRSFLGLKRTDVELVLQGHVAGNDIFWKRMEGLIDGHPRIRVDMNTYSDEELFRLISSFDLGMAWYRGLSNSSNWLHLLKSSGKIATYLWNGLGVVTNCVPHDDGPFFALKELNDETLANCLSRYSEIRKNCAHLARMNAELNYNIEPCLKNIFSLE